MAHHTRLLTLCALLVTTAAQAQITTSPAGAGGPIDMRQPSLALHMVVQTQGTFGIGVPIRIFAYPDSTMSSLASFNTAAGWPLADGRLLPINTNQALFSQIGTTYGGNGINNFAMPDLRARTLMGESPAFLRATVSGTATTTLTIANLPAHTHAYAFSPTGQTSPTGSNAPFSGFQPALAINPIVLKAGIFPSRDGPFAGMAVSPTQGFYSQLQFLSTSAFGSQADYRVPAQGALLPIAQNTALFSLMGTTYGGNGMSNFALPDLRSRLTVSQGEGPDLTRRELGEYFGAFQTILTTANLPPHAHAVAGHPATGVAGAGSPFSAVQPTLAVTYFIAVNGVYPNPNSMNDQVGYTGEIIAMALGSDNFAPSGYLPCDGSLILIEEYDTLFNLIGTTFGGNGTTTFGLPDLRGRVPVGAQLGGALPAGTRLGAESTTLTLANIPPHTHTIPCPADFGRAGGLAGQDNVLDNNDFIAYINLFFAGSTLADIGRAGGLPGADGALDNNDFIVLITRFFSPC